MSRLSVASLAWAAFVTPVCWPRVTRQPRSIPTAGQSAGRWRGTPVSPTIGSRQARRGRAPAAARLSAGRHQRGLSWAWGWSARVDRTPSPMGGPVAARRPLPRRPMIAGSEPTLSQPECAALGPWDALRRRRRAPRRRPMARAGPWALKDDGGYAVTSSPSAASFGTPKEACSWTSFHSPSSWWYTRVCRPVTSLPSGSRKVGPLSIAQPTLPSR